MIYLFIDYCNLIYVFNAQNFMAMNNNINNYLNWIPSTFNVIGCEYSTDIDIIVPVPSIQIITDYKNKKFNLN